MSVMNGQVFMKKYTPATMHISYNYKIFIVETAETLSGIVMLYSW